MDATTYTELNMRVADVLATLSENDEFHGVGIAQMGDGSGRFFARISTYDRVNELEQEFRVTTPAPLGGPSWTWTMTEWTTEVRIGETWAPMEVAA